LNTVDTVSLEDTMADTNSVVERKNSDLEAKKSSTEKLKINSDSGSQESQCNHYQYTTLNIHVNIEGVSGSKRSASALNMMVTDFYNTYCSKPWIVISVISGIIYLSLHLSKLT